MSIPQMADSKEMEAFQAYSGLTPNKNYVRFFLEAEVNEAKSNEAGRPIYEEKEYITIQVPGDKENIIVRPIRPTDKHMYAQQYAAFKANREAPQEGTPLDKLPFMTKAQVMEFNSVGIKTAEQVVEMSDILAQKFMGINAIKKRVADFLSAAAGNAPNEKLQAELSKRDDTIALLKATIDDLAKKFDESKKTTK
jgi:hypothetical protein